MRLLFFFVVALTYEKVYELDVHAMFDHQKEFYTHKEKQLQHTEC